MLPTTFPESNFVYTKPAGWTDEQCSDLPVFEGAYPDGTPVIVSCWRLNKEEMELIQQTGCVYLMVIGQGTPPVSLHIESPFTAAAAEE
ncbi:hypothetical protein [Flaviaesturariibacter amylovorans]|uniref:Uncharacterized protein n=1 Tax=Flaviaesturariibacter amylovorans TaxID=1084520 RepID=A0ABP8GQL0_9BACT